MIENLEIGQQFNFFLSMTKQSIYYIVAPLTYPITHNGLCMISCGKGHSSFFAIG